MTKYNPSNCSFDDRIDFHEVSNSELLIPPNAHQHSQTGKNIPKSIAKSSIFLTCLTVIIIQSMLLVRLMNERNQLLLSLNGLTLEKNVNRKIYEHSKYTSHNETEASEAWGSILAGHGVIAIDTEYAAKKNLPNTVQALDGSTNLIYIIEAYHAIHCIANIRSHYVALEQGKPGNWSRPHDLHCFDALRQYVMCNIDDTLLWTTGNRESGTGQEKKCNDWDALRDWAEERTANYFDVEPGTGVSHINNYHAGDGLPIGSLS